MSMEQGLESLEIEDDEDEDEDEDEDNSDLEWNMSPLFADDNDETEIEFNFVTHVVKAVDSQNDIAEVTLDDFRKEWKSELDPHVKKSSSMLIEVGSTHEEKLHDSAMKLSFDCERRGDMCETVQRYMVPDIESKLYGHHSLSSLQNLSCTKDCTESEDCDRSSMSHHCNLGKNSDLREILRYRISIRGKLFEPEFLDEPCPIALMSAELMCILMRYIVGSELDVYNLELLSMTSSGFYIFARDENLWLAICRSTFRDKYANSVSFDKFVSWRQMYITLPHVYLHGIYIGKISYLRNGEPSFQDKFYKPWHIVVYYRILRFFADGTALMITTADAPSQVVGLLKSKTPSAAGILIGRYWILDQDCIKAEFYRRCEQTVQRKRRTHKSRHQLLPYGVIDQKFDMKLHFGDGKKRQAHCVLHLNEYTCTVTYSNGEKSTNSLDTSDHQTYPPLFFSRVKSYSVPDGWDNILA